MVLLISLWLGFLTSITPCVFSANLAIISFICKKFNSNFYIIKAILIYIIGRILFYLILSLILSYFIENIIPVYLFIQNKLNIIIGIILIFVSLVLLNIINDDFLNFSFADKIKKKTKNSEYIGSFTLGILFASMFCPVTASLFFANLLQSSKNIFAFLLYGFGTGLTSLFIIFLFILSKNKFKKFYKKIDLFKNYSSKITGIIFFIIGIFLIFGLF